MDEHTLLSNLLCREWKSLIVVTTVLCNLILDVSSQDLKCSEAEVTKPFGHGNMIL